MFITLKRDILLIPLHFPIIPTVFLRHFIRCCLRIKILLVIIVYMYQICHQRSLYFHHRICCRLGIRVLTYDLSVVQVSFFHFLYPCFMCLIVTVRLIMFFLTIVPCFNSNRNCCCICDRFKFLRLVAPSKILM